LKNNNLRTLGLVILILIFAVGVFQLFVLGFKSGEIYPAYSSLRSDPLGTRALYESLEQFSHIQIDRNHRPLNFLKFEEGTTFFYLGEPQSNWNSVPAELSGAIDRLTRSGGRLVMSFLPEQKQSAGGGETSGTSQKELHPVTEAKQAKKFIPISNYWGVDFSFNAEILTEESKYLDLVATSNLPGFPSVISWHTNLYFRLLDSSWRVLYACDGQPVIIERSFGKGRIILCADSYIFSNEALWLERHPGLLAWVIGNNANILFDEAHLGIYERLGVAGLIRQYRFHWFFSALVVLALLFVWKSAVYFVPPSRRPRAADKVISEKDDTQGFFALLKRNIPAGEILATCIQEWERSFNKDRRVSPGTIAHINRILSPKSRSSRKRTDIVGGYQTIGRIISKDKRYE